MQLRVLHTAGRQARTTLEDTFCPRAALGSPILPFGKTFRAAKSLTRRKRVLYFMQHFHCMQRQGVRREQMRSMTKWEKLIASMRPSENEGSTHHVACEQPTLSP